MESLILITKEELKDTITDCVNSCLQSFNPNPPQADENISRKEAAAILRITLPTLQHYTLEGRIKGYRIGRRVLYKKSEVEAAIEPMRVSK